MSRASFNRIAYETMDVCNPVGFARIDAVLAKADLASGARALDIGCGNATVAAHLARRWGLAVTAVERDPAMAALARSRIGDSGVMVIEGDAGAVLDDPPPFDLIVVMGATDAAASGERDPTRVFQRLRDALAPGGVLLWGEPFWVAEPSPPFRLIIELTNHYETRDGWEAAARAAGLAVADFNPSDTADWEAYAAQIDTAVRTWVADHSDAPEAKGLIARADAMQSLFQEEGRDVLGFGLWLFRREG